MAGYRHSGHEMCKSKYHWVLITRTVTTYRGCETAECARDLIMLATAPAHMAPSQLVEYMKGILRGRLQEEFPSLRMCYWGQHL